MPIRPRNDEGRERWGHFDLTIAGSSHVGRVRQVNQDAFDRFDDPERGDLLFVVADGLGGHRAGEVASKMAVGTLGKLFAEGDEDPPTRLRRAIERADDEIRKRAEKNSMYKGMGTTVVALLLCEDGPSYVAHVGDSRLYRLRDESFEALTEDHSVVASLLRDGAITPEEARDHPKRNQILRALGVHNDVDVEIAEVGIAPGDTYLLCSDGLYAMIPEEDVEVFARRAPDADSGVAWMIDAANQAGGTDNITALLVGISLADE